MNQNKIIRVKTEHSMEFKTLFEVLKETLPDVNITFIQDSGVDNNSEKNVEPHEVLFEEGNEEDDEVTGENNKMYVNEEKENNNVNETIPKKNTDKLQQKEIVGGMRIIALDPHLTLMIYVKLASTNFVEYYVRYPSFNVGLDLSELHKFLKCVDKDSIMTISVDKDDEQKIEFHLQNQIKGIDLHYKQKLMDIDDSTERIPRETHFEMYVIMDTQDFKKICSDMSQFSEHIEIICTSKEITFRCLGDQTELVKTFKNGENGGVKIMCLKNDKKPVIVQAIYNIKHLLTFGKCVNLCNEMQLYLKNNWPLFIKYTIGNLGKMLVGLAPYDEKSIKRNSEYSDKVK